MQKNICKEGVFREVYDLHIVSVRNFIYYKSGNLQLAEDVAHDAFSKLWENCSKVIFESAKSYLYTVGNNLFINQMKKKQTRLKFDRSINEKTNHHDPQFLLEEEEFKTKLDNAISNLPEKQRVVFLMNRIDKLKYREIAEILNLSVKAVEKRMHLALKELKEVHQDI